MGQTVFDYNRTDDMNRAYMAQLTNCRGCYQCGNLRVQGADFSRCLIYDREFHSVGAAEEFYQKACQGRAKS